MLTHCKVFCSSAQLYYITILVTDSNKCCFGVGFYPALITVKQLIILNNKEFEFESFSYKLITILAHHKYPISIEGMPFNEYVFEIVDNIKPCTI